MIWPSSASRATSPSGRSSTRDGAEPVERGDDDERARARAPSGRRRARPGGRRREIRPRDDVVDAVLAGGVGVGAVLEQEEDAVGCALGLLVEQQAERDLRAGLDLVEAGEARELRRRPRRRARGRRARCRRPRRRARERAPTPAPSGELDAEPAARRRSRRSSAARRRRRRAATFSGSSASPSRQRVHSATVGQVVVGRGRADDEAEVPGAQRRSRRSRRAARRGLIARTAGGGRDLVDLADEGEDRAGRCRPASRAARRSRSRPRACGCGRRTGAGSRRAPGPGQATQPSASRNRRWRSRGSSASRSWSWRMKSTRWRSDFTGSSMRKPVRLTQAGTAKRASRLLGEQAGGAGRDVLGEAERHRRARVDRAAEGDQRRDALRRGGRRRPGSRTSRPGCSRRGGRRGPSSLRTVSTASRDGEHVVGERALEAALLAARARRSRRPTGRRRCSCRIADGGGGGGDVVDVGVEHHRRDEDHRRAVGASASAPSAK